MTEREEAGAARQFFMRRRASLMYELHHATEDLKVIDEAINSSLSGNYDDDKLNKKTLATLYMERESIKIRIRVSLDDIDYVDEVISTIGEYKGE